VLRAVLRSDIDEATTERFIDGLRGFVAELGDDPFGLLLDARDKSFTGLAAQKRMSLGTRELLAGQPIRAAALTTSPAWQGGDIDGAMHCATMNQAWAHVAPDATAPTVALVAGSTGAGKTSLSHFLATDLDALVFSVDEWMAKLFAADKPSDAGFDWYMERIERIGAQVRSMAEQALAQNKTVVIDFGFTESTQRGDWLAWAKGLGHDPWIYFVDVDADERWRRVQQRSATRTHDDPQAVSRAMFDFVEARFEPPTQSEGNLAVVRW
jgi:predicted kinase